MPKKQKRDNDYYLSKLKADHPGIYKDFLDGKYRNASEALAASGLRPKVTPLQQLKRAWSKASVAERDAFKVIIGCQQAPAGLAPRHGSAPASMTAATKAPAGKVSIDPRLASALRAIMLARGIKNGDVMREIDENPLDTSFSMALARDTLISRELAEKLAAWGR